jgi:hypothetical protein
MSNETQAMQAGPNAEREAQRRVTKQYASTHTLLDDYGIERPNSQQIGVGKFDKRWLDLQERVQLLHANTERWRQRAFRAERELEEATFQPDAPEDSDKETEPHAA